MAPASSFMGSNQDGPAVDLDHLRPNRSTHRVKARYRENILEITRQQLAERSSLKSA